MNKRKYLVYKITNRFNKKIYIGVHSTLNENDRYMGSGIEIKEVLKKEGRKSFVKEILFTFDTKEEMFSKEKELVTKEFCMREDTYNRIEGGGTYLTIDMVSVVDKDGNNFRVYRDDPRYVSGELISNMVGVVPVKDIDGNHFMVNRNDLRYLSGELTSINSGTVIVKDINGVRSRVSINDPRYLSGELVANAKGTNRHQKWLGKTHKEESKGKIGLANSIKQKGKANSQFGTCWITKEGINKKIKKENLNQFEEEGWVKGRKNIQSL